MLASTKSIRNGSSSANSMAAVPREPSAHGHRCRLTRHRGCTGNIGLSPVELNDVVQDAVGTIRLQHLDDLDVHIALTRSNAVAGIGTVPFFIPRCGVDYAVGQEALQDFDRRNIALGGAVDVLEL